MTTLKQEVGELKARLERLEAMVHSLAGDTHKAGLPAAGEPQNQDQLLAWLKTQGLIREPTPEEHRLAAEWDTLWRRRSRPTSVSCVALPLTHR